MTKKNVGKDRPAFSDKLKKKKEADARRNGRSAKGKKKRKSKLTVTKRRRRRLSAEEKDSQLSDKYVTSCFWSSGNPSDRAMRWLKHFRKLHPVKPNDINGRWKPTGVMIYHGGE
jgi:hypothetical protein